MPDPTSDGAAGGRGLSREDQRGCETLKLALIEAEQNGVSPRKVGDMVAAAKHRLGYG